MADPKGTAIYPPLPGDGVQAADLFTNPPAVCKELAPCIETVDQVTQKCVQYENQKTGTKKTCVKYDTVPVFGNVCTATKDVFKGKVDDLTKCTDWKKESAGFVNGACIKDEGPTQDQDGVHHRAEASTRLPRPVTATTTNVRRCRTGR